MKTLLPLSLLLLLLSGACDVVDPLDARDETRIPDEQAVTNLTTAELALTGVYGQLINLKVDVYYSLLGTLLGPEIIPNPQVNNLSHNRFNSNTITTDDGTVWEAYRNIYKLINAANHLIERLEPLAIEADRKTEILGEARFLRALGHLTLLQYWGQFYDTASDYGIVVRKAGVRSKDLYSLVKRSSVAETYSFILEDLDYAIANAPAYPASTGNGGGGGLPPGFPTTPADDHGFPPTTTQSPTDGGGAPTGGLPPTTTDTPTDEGGDHGFPPTSTQTPTDGGGDHGLPPGLGGDQDSVAGEHVALQANRLAAQGLKAKVLFYQNRFTEAAALIDQILANPSIGLESDYAQVFTKRTRSREVLFASYGDGSVREISQINQPWGSFGGLSLSPAYLAWLESDPRAETAIRISDDFGIEVLQNGKFSKPSDDESLEASGLLLRLAELYLIQAEAWVRAGNIAAGQAALNQIRARAGLFPEFSNSPESLLAAIRLEKIKELGTETGSTWLDMVRYAVLDGLNLQPIKDGLNSPHQYILPMPQASVDRGVVVQNPGY